MSAVKSTAIAITNLTEEQVDLIKQTLAKGATDNELKLFLHLANTYGLDPFAKEIWCVKLGTGAALIFTSRDGYLKIANGHPAFDGIQGDTVCENDVLTKCENGAVQHAYGQPRGAVVGAYALVYRKDRSRPTYFYAPLCEYKGRSGVWTQYPSAMILKVAEAMALKRAFSISGLVTREELDASEPEPTATTAPATPVLLALPAGVTTANNVAPPAPLTTATATKLLSIADQMTGDEEAGLRDWLTSGKANEAGGVKLLEKAALRGIWPALEVVEMLPA